MAKGRKKLGSYRPVPAWWRKQLAAWLDKERGRRVWLAAQIGCAESSITALTQPPRHGRGEGTSRIADRVAQLSGIPLPDEATFEKFGELLSEATRVADYSPSAVEGAIALLRAVRHEHERLKSSDRPDAQPPRANFIPRGGTKGDEE